MRGEYEGRWSSVDRVRAGSEEEEGVPRRDQDAEMMVKGTRASPLTRMMMVEKRRAGEDDEEEAG